MEAITLVALLFCIAVPSQVVSMRNRAADEVVSMMINENIDTVFEAQDKNLDVLINLDSVVANTGPKFVGLTLDSSIFRRVWKTFNVSSKALHSLVKGLSPSILRVGGSAADFFIFNKTSTPHNSSDLHDDEGGDPDVETPRIQNYTVTGEEWERLNYLVQVAGFDMIFDFNEFLRRGDSWDPDNARTLLAFSAERNYSFSCFQMGNEPNQYYRNFHFRIPGFKLAKDMQLLKNLLSEFPAYNNSCILGPDVTKVTTTSARYYLQEFLQKGGKDIVTAVTLHHYYPSTIEHYPCLDDFVNITILNSLKQELEIGISTAHTFAPGLPVWLSETSSVIGGGLEGVSNGYAAGFMWLDKLGMSAEYGLEAVLRQCLYNNDYAVIADDFTPYPDYYLTILYKRLVQGPVFKVITSTDTVRMYASCANPSTYQKGALTVYILNVRNEPAPLNFVQFTNQQYELYLLTPADHDGLRSASVALNGQKLQMVGDELPPLPPLLCSGTITFPAYSFGFVVIPKANISLCMT